MSNEEKLVSKNPTAYHNFDITEKIECGIVLSGTEIKSIRNGKVNIKDSYASVDKNGEAVVFKNNKPKYLVIDMENSDFILDLSDDEKIDIIAQRILKRYLPAFQELAK